MGVFKGHVFPVDASGMSSATHGEAPFTMQ
jgi:hypothetical protein